MTVTKQRVTDEELNRAARVLVARLSALEGRGTGTDTPEPGRRPAMPEPRARLAPRRPAA